MCILLPGTGQNMVGSQYLLTMCPSFKSPFYSLPKSGLEGRGGYFQTPVSALESRMIRGSYDYSLALPEEERSRKIWETQKWPFSARGRTNLKQDQAGVWDLEGIFSPHFYVSFPGLFLSVPFCTSRVLLPSLRAGPFQSLLTCPAARSPPTLLKVTHWQSWDRAGAETCLSGKLWTYQPQINEIRLFGWVTGLLARHFRALASWCLSSCSHLGSWH